MNFKDKNKHIAQSMRETFEKRKSQICKVFEFKVDKSSLNLKQKEYVKMFFVEAKWIYNYLLSQEDIYHFDYKNLVNITHKDKNGNDINVTISHIGSSLKQSIISQIVSQIKGLHTHKNKGDKIGKLKFKSEYNSINLKQYGVTHKIKGNNKIKIQGIKDPIRVRGIEQLYKYKNIDIANAKLIYDGNDYFIKLTCFIPKEINNRKTYKRDICGIDMGISTTITLSYGDKINISVEESERLKRLQRKLSLKQKGSNNRYKLIQKIKKEYKHISNIKNDKANKIVHNLLDENKIIVIQDEQISNWHKTEYMSNKVQHSILGRIKSKLLEHTNQVIVLDKYFPTTKYCTNCKHSYDIKLQEREFICPYCGKKEDRDIHAAKNMIYFYQHYNNITDTLGTNDTDKKPRKISSMGFRTEFSKSNLISQRKQQSL